MQYDIENVSPTCQKHLLFQVKLRTKFIQKKYGFLWTISITVYKTYTFGA